jgi:DNA-binding NarL/FixJ family response regulator
MRVVLADDHPMILRGVRGTLEVQEGVQVVAAVTTGDGALQAVCEHKPDLLVLDLSMPGLTPEEIVLQGREEHPDLKVLILTAYSDDYHLMKVAQMPISGYLIKDEAPEHLEQAVRVIGQGAVWFSQCIADRIRGLVKSAPDSEPDTPAGLTLRECQVLELLAQGMDNGMIACRLNLAQLHQHSLPEARGGVADGSAGVGPQAFRSR